MVHNTCVVNDELGSCQLITEGGMLLQHVVTSLLQTGRQYLQRGSILPRLWVRKLVAPAGLAQVLQKCGDNLQLALPQSCAAVPPALWLC